MVVKLLLPSIVGCRYHGCICDDVLSPKHGVVDCVGLCAHHSTPGTVRLWALGEQTIENYFTPHTCYIYLPAFYLLYLLQVYESAYVPEYGNAEFPPRCERKLDFPITNLTSTQFRVSQIFGSRLKSIQH